jgi:mannose-6-phosphate isomerase
MTIFRLLPHLQHHLWGKLGRNSAIFRLLDKATQNQIAESTPLAESWYGSHPKGSAIEAQSRQKLSLLLEKPLSFLLKVLSIKTPLSLQVHPNSEIASALTTKDPLNYPDSNGKPEAGIALTPTGILYGFRPEVSNPKKIIEEFFLSNNERKEALICKLLNAFPISEKAKEAFNQISQDYGPYDSALLFFGLLNFIELSPYEALFIDVGTPHAYLYGDILEFMLPSDNTIRIGGTPKFVDKEAFFFATDFPPTKNRSSLLKPKVFSDRFYTTNLYTPPSLPRLEIITLGEILDEDVTLVRGFEEGLLLILDGGGTLTFTDKTFSLASGDAFYLSTNNLPTPLHFNFSKSSLDKSINITPLHFALCTTT